jgi:hypothetical protein
VYACMNRRGGPSSIFHNLLKFSEIPYTLLPRPPLSEQPNPTYCVNVLQVKSRVTSKHMLMHIVKLLTTLKYMREIGTVGIMPISNILTPRPDCSTVTKKKAQVT